MTRKKKRDKTIPLKRQTFYLSQEQIEDIKILRFLTNKGTSELIRDAIDQLIRDNQKQIARVRELRSQYQNG